ncbi:hypothetical protein [Labrys sp. 22185]|uniref:hypothetical protein n=1 Tax=Labrys sp. 22185 TaxID=3453888 RepID=UPI003F87C485
MEAPILVDPHQFLPGGWTICLPFPMARRIEGGSLVFWHTPKGLTFWISAGERHGIDDPIDNWRAVRSGAAEDERIERDGELVRLSYRLVEESGDARQPAFYGFVIAGKTEFLIASYFDKSEMIDPVLQTWRSVRRMNA